MDNRWAEAISLIYEDGDLLGAEEKIYSLSGWRVEGLRGIIKYYLMDLETSHSLLKKGINEVTINSEDDAFRLAYLRIKLFSVCQFLDDDSGHFHGTNQLLKEAKSDPRTQNKECLSLTEKMMGCAALMNQNYELAIELFTKQIPSIESSKGIHQKTIGPYIGLSMASYSMGKLEQAIKYYESAKLALSFTSEYLIKGIYCAHLAALTPLLNLENESKSWLHTIDELNFPEATESAIIKRSKVLTNASEKKILLIL